MMKVTTAAGPVLPPGWNHTPALQGSANVSSLLAADAFGPHGWDRDDQ